MEDFTPTIEWKRVVAAAVLGDNLKLHIAAHSILISFSPATIASSANLLPDTTIRLKRCSKKCGSNRWLNGWKMLGKMGETTLRFSRFPRADRKTNSKGYLLFRGWPSVCSCLFRFPFAMIYYFLTSEMFQDCCFNSTGIGNHLAHWNNRNMYIFCVRYLHSNVKCLDLQIT